MNTLLPTAETEAPSVSLSKPYYPVLTGLRALAAYLVFLSHDNIFSSGAIQGMPEKLQSALTRFVTFFSIGVAVFFVLSGFLITTRYQDNIQFKWQWAKRYLRSRVARIYPIYFLVTVCTLLATTINAAYDPSRLWHLYTLKDKIFVVFLNLTFLRGFFDHYFASMAGQGWSLTVEECFYLSAPFMLLGLRKSWRWLLLYPALLLGIGLLLTAVGSTFHDLLHGFFGSVKFMLNWTFFGRCIEFVMGMGLALFVRRHPRKAQSGFVFTLAGFSWMMVCAAVMAYLERNAGDGAVWHLANYSTFFVNNVVLPVGIVLFFWGLLHERTLVKRLLETPLFDLLGKSSYSFYLIHVGVLDFLLNRYVSSNIGIKFILINLVAIALYKLVEHPLHAWLAGQRATAKV